HPPLTRRRWCRSWRACPQNLHHPDARTDGGQRRILTTLVATEAAYVSPAAGVKVTVTRPLVEPFFDSLGSVTFLVRSALTVAYRVTVRDPCLTWIRTVPDSEATTLTTGFFPRLSVDDPIRTDVLRLLT